MCLIILQIPCFFKQDKFLNKKNIYIFISKEYNTINTINGITFSIEYYHSNTGINKNVTVKFLNRIWFYNIILKQNFGDKRNTKFFWYKFF